MTGAVEEFRTRPLPEQLGFRVFPSENGFFGSLGIGEDTWQFQNFHQRHLTGYIAPIDLRHVHHTGFDKFNQLHTAKA